MKRGMRSKIIGNTLWAIGARAQFRQPFARRRWHRGAVPGCCRRRLGVAWPTLWPTVERPCPAPLRAPPATTAASVPPRRSAPVATALRPFRCKPLGKKKKK